MWARVLPVEPDPYMCKVQQASEAKGEIWLLQISAVEGNFHIYGTTFDDDLCGNVSAILIA